MRQTVVFDSIVGHERILGTLRRAAAEDRLPSSLLFHGPDGVGKRLTAFALAAALNCTEAPAEGCGECAACRRILKGYGETRLKTAEAQRAPGHHADVLYYPPRRRQIRIEQVHDLRREAGYRPFEGRRRVFVIDPADRMNREAANALLKTLEEPPASSCLVLLTASPGALPATIRSRCQAYRFAPLAPETLAALLVSRGRDRKEADRLARVAGGSVGRALAVDLEAHDALRERVLAVLEARPGSEAWLAALGLAADAGADGESFEEVGRMLTSLLRDLALVRDGADPDCLVHADLAGRLGPLGERFGARAPEAIERMEEAARRVRGNVNPRLAAEAVLLDLAGRATP